MNRIVLVTIIILVLVSVSMLVYFFTNKDVERNIGIKANKDNPDSVISMNEPKRPPIPDFVPDEKWLKDWQKKWDKQMALEDAKFAKELASIPIDMDSILKSIRSDEITQDDLLEIKTMLSKFKTGDTVTEEAIIETLIGFFPDDKRFPGLRGILTDYYEGLEGLYGGKLTKDQKLLMVVHFTQNQISITRDIDEQVTEKMKIRRQLLKTDPDLYYDTEIASVNSSITETENLITDAEARGDMEVAETYRSHLLALNKRIDELDFERNFDEEIEKMKQQILKERFPDGNYHDWVNEMVDEMQAELLNNDEINNTTLNKSTSQSSSHSNDNKSLEGLLSGVGEKYLDVVISRYFTPEEFKEYYPNVSDTSQLKARTVEMQTELAMEVRKVLNTMEDISTGDKRKLASEFLNKNYDKEFAKEVLKLLYNPSD